MQHWLICGGAEEEEMSETIYVLRTPKFVSELEPFQNVNS